jgi:hypothetical protein
MVLTPHSKSIDWLAGLESKTQWFAEYKKHISLQKQTLALSECIKEKIF